MKYLLSFCFWLLVVGSAFAGELEFVPAEVPQGGVVTLYYHGEQPQSVEVEFLGSSLLLYRVSTGAKRLLVVDLTAEPGTHQIPVRIVSHDGKLEQRQIALLVTPRVNEVERLSLPDEMVSPKRPEVLNRIANEAEVLKKLFLRDTPPLFASGLRLPVSDTIGSRFGLQRILNGQPRSPHTGLDFRSPRGRSILAPTAAVVAGTGEYYFTGKTVMLDHGGGLLSLFAHLEQISVRVGDTVEQGQSIGTVGSTGRATGAHLHWSVRLNNARIDPVGLFEAFNGKKP